MYIYIYSERERVASHLQLLEGIKVLRAGLVLWLWFGLGLLRHCLLSIRRHLAKQRLRDGGIPRWAEFSMIKCLQQTTHEKCVQDECAVTALFVCMMSAVVTALCHTYRYIYIYTCIQNRLGYGSYTCTKQIRLRFFSTLHHTFLHQGKNQQAII